MPRITSLFVSKYVKLASKQVLKGYKRNFVVVCIQKRCHTTLNRNLKQPLSLKKENATILKNKNNKLI